MGGEAMAFGFESGLDFGVVEELAVEDDDDGAVLVGDGLPAVREADDAEPSIRQADAGRFEEAVLVRPAVNDGTGHAGEQSRGNRALPRQIDDARDATHALPTRFQPGASLRAQLA